MAHDDGRRPERSAEERQADHAAIERLADDLLPALVAKLGATGLGELEVREGGWKVRLRMPERRTGRRSAARPAGEVGAPSAGGQAGSFVGAAQGALPAGQSGAAGTPDPGAPPVAVRRAIATSPAVGFFRPLAGLSSGARVRSGDRVGLVDVLGVAQEVLAPVDGRVGATIVEPGEPVEYGQEVVEIELLPNGASHDGSSAGAPEGPAPARSAAGAPVPATADPPTGASADASAGADTDATAGAADDASAGASADAGVAAGVVADATSAASVVLPPSAAAG